MHIVAQHLLDSYIVHRKIDMDSAKGGGWLDARK